MKKLNEVELCSIREGASKLSLSMQKLNRRSFVAAGAALTAAYIGRPLGALAQTPNKMRIAFTVAKDSLTDQQTHIFIDELNKTVPGAFDITVYPGSQLGTGTEIAQSVQLGTLEAAALGSEGVSVDPSLAIFELPWVFPDSAAYQKAVSGPFFDEVSKVYDQRGLVLLSIFSQGFRDVLAQTPYASLKDMKGQRIRIAPSPARVAFFKELGAIPITIQWADTYLALQQGTVDGVEAFPIYLRSGKMYEQAKNLNYIHYVSAPVFLCVSKAYWAGLSKKDQQAMLKAGRAAMERGNKLSATEEQKNIDAMLEQGVKMVETDLTGYEDIRAKLLKDYESKFGSDWLKMIGIA